MISNLEYLNAPMWVIIIIVLLVVLVEITKGISYLWGVLAPKILKIQTSASRRKQLDDIIIANQEEIKLLRSEQLSNKNDIECLSDKIDKCLDMQLKRTLEEKRMRIIDFASAVASGRPYTREQFNEIISLYDEYEEIIKENSLTNGRVDISIEIINQKYKENILNGGFLEEKYTELLQEAIKNKKEK